MVEGATGMKSQGKVSESQADAVLSSFGGL